MVMGHHHLFQFVIFQIIACIGSTRQEKEVGRGKTVHIFKESISLNRDALRPIYSLTAHQRNHNDLKFCTTHKINRYDCLAGLKSINQESVYSCHILWFFILNQREIQTPKDSDSRITASKNYK